MNNIVSKIEKTLALFQIIVVSQLISIVSFGFIGTIDSSNIVTINNNNFNMIGINSSGVIDRDTSAVKIYYEQKW